MKILKLALIAFVIIGATVGLAIIIPDSDNKLPEPDLNSAQANEWKMKINNLCKEGKWTAIGYNKIETGIHTDYIASKGNLLTKDEELALKRYLFAMSCDNLKTSVDKLFKQTSYDQGKMKTYEDMLSFLREKSAGQGTNSNLMDAANIYAAYHQLLSLLSSKGVSASYSRPLKAFTGDGAANRKARIKSASYYKSHFSNNTSIRSKVESLDRESSSSESRYYDALERLVESHYNSTHDIEALLEDQMRFDEISTNSSAKARLNNFVNNTSN